MKYFFVATIGLLLIGSGCRAVAPLAPQEEKKSIYGKPIPKEATQPTSLRSFEYFKAGTEASLACTAPCSVEDDVFFDTYFVGLELGMAALKEATGGVMPQEPLEYHPAKDGDCFTKGYGEHPTGYATSIQGKNIACGADYYRYDRGTWDLASQATIARQTLPIHEAIHHIFSDYATPGYSAPEYAIQESIAKAVSLKAVGTISGYGDQFLAGRNYNLDNPPPKENRGAHSNFFVYSLHHRYGFDEADMKKLFQEYKQMADVPLAGNEKIKQILDDILNTDTSQSFKDIGVIY